MPKGAKRARDKNKGLKGQIELQFKTVDQEYAIVVKTLGDCRMQCRFPDGSLKIAHVRGKMKNKQRVYIGDLVLTSKREFEEDKVDIISLYNKEDARRLKSLGEVDESFVSGTKTTDEIEFDDQIKEEDEKNLDLDDL